MVTGLDHIQLALPAGAESRMRQFYCAHLRLVEVTKPAALQARGGFWAKAGESDIHFGVDPDFYPATKAHPAFVVKDIQQLAQQLFGAGFDVRWDRALPAVIRFFTTDPAGNRIEIIASP